MTIALSPSAMRLSELITIYLAAAAPVGVSYFMRRTAHAHRSAQLLRAIAIALLWPLTLGAQLLARKRREHSERSTRPTHETRVATAERALVKTLYQTDDLLRDAYAASGARAREAADDTRLSVERFVGLTLALASEESQASPTARELELYRVAGRKGDDLLIAGHCVRRRNLARLRAHHEQARHSLIHALAELLETVEHDLPARTANASSFAQTYWLVIRVFAQAIDLLSLLDDQSAATSVARLMDAACAWARRHEVLALPRANTEQTGGVLCPPLSTSTTNATRPTPQPTA